MFDAIQAPQPVGQVFIGLGADPSTRGRQELCTMFTHDLRSPLTAIQGCLEMLDVGRAEEFTPRTKRIIQIATRNTTRASELVNDLLDCQKMQAGKLSLDACRVELADVFEDIDLDLSGWIEEFNIAIHFDRTDIAVKANRRILSRIMFNLISNALRFAPRGSIIGVRVAVNGALARISVSDQGPGIPKHKQEAIFDRFEQMADDADNTPGSSGLGLSICRDFVRLHGGTIWVTSEVDHGSTFHFTLPLAR